MARKDINSAISLLKRITEKTLLPENLTRHQRRVCVRYFMNEKPEVTDSQIAQLIGVTRSSVSRYKNTIISQDGWIVDRIDPRNAAVDLHITAETMFTKLCQAGRWESAWRVKREYYDKMFELGHLNKAPVKVEGMISLLEILKLAHDERIPTERLASREGRNGGVLEKARN